MKEKLFCLTLALILIGCVKNDKEDLTSIKEIGVKDYYPKGNFKEKIDSVDNPKIYDVNIAVDFSKSSSDKNVLISDDKLYISSILFQISKYDYSSPRFVVRKTDRNGNLIYHDPHWVDLNKGVGGNFIYFYYKTDTDPDWAINGLSVSFESWTTGCIDIATGYAADLNSGAGGSYVKLHSYNNIYYRLNSYSEYDDDCGFIGLGVIIGNSSTIKAPYGWYKIPGDLNKGCGGPFIYFIYKRYKDRNL